MTPSRPPTGPRPLGSPPGGVHPYDPAMGRLGMRLFLLTLAVLFAASIAGYLVVRSRAAAWPPPGMPRLPSGLWVSTLIILLCSASIQWALRSVRRGRQGTLRAGLLLTLMLGLGFLVSQTANWLWLLSAQIHGRPNLYAFTTYMLTGLHAAHVIGGIILLIVVRIKAGRGQYSSDYHPGVEYSAMYWHFLDAVWLVMFAVMFVFA